MGVVTIGLEKIEIAPVGVDGTPGTVFVAFGNVSTDSLAFAEEDGTTKTVDIEESNAPLKIFKTKGNLVLTANIADANADMYSLVRGGTVTTASGTKTYSEGDTVANVERTVRITPAEGLAYTINRCGIDGKLVGGLGKNQELFLAITLTALKPIKDGVPVFTAVETVPVA